MKKLTAMLLLTALLVAVISTSAFAAQYRRSTSTVYVGWKHFKGWAYCSSPSGAPTTVYSIGAQAYPAGGITYWYLINSSGSVVRSGNIIHWTAYGNTNNIPDTRVYSGWKIQYKTWGYNAYLRF